MSAEAPPARWTLRRAQPLAKRLLQLAVLVLVVALLWRAVGLLSWRELGRLIAAADLRWTLFGLALLVGRYLVWTLRWRLALRCLGRLPSVLHSFFTIVGAVAANGFTPTAPVVGGLMRARHGAGAGDHVFGRVYGVVLFDQVAHQLVVGTNATLAVIATAAWLGKPGFAAALAAAFLLAVAVTAWWLRGLDEARVGRITGWLEARLARRGRGTLAAVHQHASEALQVVQRLLGERWLRRLALLLGLVFVAFNALALWAMLHAIGRPTDPLTAWAAVAVGGLAGAFGGTPGGVATTEAGMVVALTALEVPELQAAAATLLFRGLHYAVVLALGIPALLLLEARLRRRLAGEETG